jgi:ppGpp synthetase/RelA/SpoT-type nucleotidyltranferase
MTDDDLPEDYDALKAAFIEMRAKVFGAEALIEHLRLVIAKMKRETIRLSQVQDISGCRVLVADLEEQDRLVAALSGIFPKITVVDRRTKTTHGYRAVHIIVELFDRAVEIQVRTESQHIWAELSEKLSDLVDASIKYGGGPPHVKERLLNSSEPWELSSRRKDFLPRQVESWRKSRRPRRHVDW